MLWVGLWGALFFIFTQVREFYGTDWLAAAVIWIPALVVCGFPVAWWWSGLGIRWYGWLAVFAWVLILSYGESELSFFISSLNPGQTGFPISYVLCFNATLAAVVTGNLMIMRAFGFRLIMPLWRPITKPTLESPAIETVAIGR
jgi:hypothetical protein